MDIRTSEQPTCTVCGTSGPFAYRGLTDKLLSAPGVWSLRACSNLACRTYWLDPQPHRDDIGKLYSGYPTRVDPPPVAALKKNILKRALGAVRSAYLERNFSYPSGLPFPTAHILSPLSWLYPTWRDSMAVEMLYVPYVAGGSLLDVGCGGGSNMVAMQARGWQVTGIDFDEPTVANARSKGLNVYTGDLASQHFPDASFDAIIMNHVIEHVPDPVNVLRECKRILKPGGTLTAFTPNAGSKGHRRFLRHWRGLEVPRHLQIFTPRALALAAESAGFSHVRGTTSVQGVLYIYDASKAMEETGSFDIAQETKLRRLLNKLRWYLAGWKHALMRGSEEVAVLKCRK